MLCFLFSCESLQLETRDIYETASPEPLDEGSKSLTRKSSFSKSIDLLSEKHRIPKLTDFFSNTSASPSTNASYFSSKEIKYAQSVGYSLYIDNQFSHGLISYEDKENLKHELSNLENVFSTSDDIEDLLLHVQDRLEHYWSIYNTKYSIANTYNFLAIIQDVLQSLTNNSLGDKRLNAFCEIPSPFCLGAHPSSVGNLTSPVIASVIGFSGPVRPVGGAAISNGSTVLPVFLTMLFLNAAFCRSVECDDCHAVGGVINLNSENGPCEWGDFVAYGGNNVFEEVQRFIWTVEFPGTTISPSVLVTNGRVLSKSLLPDLTNITDIQISIDVECDQDVMFPWPFLEPKLFTLEGHQTRDVPSIVAPTNDSYFFEAGESICFEVPVSSTWHVASWSAVGAQPTSQVGPDRTFCTTFLDSSTFGISATLENSCTGQNIEIFVSILVLDL